MAKRKSRKKVVKKVDTTKPLEPFDITQFGTDDDPCFGKHYDLTADECKICGDCTVCAIVYNQQTEKLRTKEEKNHRFKDLELDKPKKGKPDKKKSYIVNLREKNIPTLKIIKKVMEKFDMEKDKAKKLVKSIK